ncbi:hypothetical protein B6U67_06065 [Methanosarcinales archaeon ex4484_138]|nr:MAG: hypothetical protein B6U67_06065 [Methanosarcinales archaeon ex4484_138]
MGERDLLEVLIYFIYLLGGFLILLKSAESVIDHAALVAVKRDISHHTIGMTLVALVTSLPEFAISTSSSFLGEPDIAIANVVGSNITNAITLTVVALGTSLPELATALIAIRKEMGAIAVGTIIGSNVLNIAFVLGTASIVKPIVVAQSVIAYYLPLMILSALLLLIIIKRGRIGRFEGSILLLLYIAFLALVGGGF